MYTIDEVGANRTGNIFIAFPLFQYCQLSDKEQVEERVTWKLTLPYINLLYGPGNSIRGSVPI